MVVYRQKLSEDSDTGSAPSTSAKASLAPSARYAKPTPAAAGKKVIVLANTKPRNLAGFKSQGMLVCARW